MAAKSNRYRIWVEHRLVHAIEVMADSAEEAQDKVYEQQIKGTYCSKHKKAEKPTCQKTPTQQNMKSHFPTCLRPMQLLLLHTECSYYIIITI